MSDRMSVQIIVGLAAIVCLIIIAVSINVWKEHASGVDAGRAEYDRVMKQNNVIAIGELSRLNDHLVVLSYETVYVWDWKTAGEYEAESVYSGSEYVNAVVLDKTAHRVRNVVIKRSDIKPVYSNWGLTQDVWSLDERLSKIERKECGLNDNPLKDKK